MEIGEKIIYQRTFTVEDIELFARVSGDRGTHHVTPDTLGRVMVHGLLTATLPTKIGGDLNYIARDMHFCFERPVYAGDTITCELTATEIQPDGGVIRLASEWVCTNQKGKVVMTGSARGIVRGGQ
ncbi:MAG: MaoC family dehydratase [Chloroflexi bacterium]|nr:MaoC family dehydratase [Chloroflexota bacterium]